MQRSSTALLHAYPVRMITATPQFLQPFKFLPLIAKASPKSTLRGM